ncbi:MAG: TetR/AcrR family transcriptional regulator C-terminal domain-containing protein [Lachnospiraceae bacterium]|nr:TetR/AcrR family transcriptional regulator C-terminal domain-containing protein [Lachnospiraceae bacterium]
MRKSDARVRYTEKVVKNAFLEILAKKPINKITVTEVCERAQINRSTFYTHYSDCFEVLEVIEQEIINDFIESLKLIKEPDERAFIMAIYTIIRQHEDACRILLFNTESHHMVDRLLNIARPVSLKTWKEKLPNISDNELEMLYTHLSYGLMNVIFTGYYKYGSEEIVNFVKRMIRCSLEALSNKKERIQ